MKEVMDMDIKVIGAGCDKCGKLYTNTLDALSELGVEVPVEKWRACGRSCCSV